MYKPGNKSPDNETAKRPSKRTAVPINKTLSIRNRKTR